MGIESIADGYVEYPVPPRIAGFVACLWSVRPRIDAPVTMVLPDGCTDLIWSMGSLFVAGPDTRVNPATAYRGQTLVGLRFDRCPPSPAWWRRTCRTAPSHSRRPAASPIRDSTS